MKQIILSGENSHKKIEEILKSINCSKYMLVCDASFEFLNIKDYFASLKIQHVVFNDFTSNPLYEDVCKGVELFNNEKCDAIVAVGGGSTLDVAKCIKLYAKMDSTDNYLNQSCFDSKIPLVAVPTTAGTGSESTRYAVIYYDGKKQSVTHESIIPDYAVLDHGVLKTLPLYQKKCTLLDALCQAIESWWSVNSTDESKEYSKTAVEMILKYKEDYLLNNSDAAAEKIMLAANFAGRAINITQTTAAHAMSYKITSMYHLPHGHAVAVCLPEVWSYMLENTDKCIDSRGKSYLSMVFDEIRDCFGSVAEFKNMLSDMQISYPKVINNRNTELKILTDSVNTVRLKNNPVALDDSVLYQIYERIVKSET